MNFGTESSSPLLEEHKSAWIKIQHDIASRVQVLSDDSASVIFSDDSASKSVRFGRIDLMAMMEALPLVNAGNRGNVYFGGVDVSFPESETDDPAIAVYVILQYPSMNVVYTATEYFRVTVPYIPGFLAFREIDPLERLVRAQQTARAELTPVAILVDGNGVLHSRGAGIACFLGVRTGIPTIGIGKTLFCDAGLTKEIVSRTVSESLSAAVGRYSPQIRPVHEGSTIDQSATQVTTKPAKFKTIDPVLLFDRRAAQPNEAGRLNGDGDAAHRGSVLKELSTLCHGLAIPLRGVVSSGSNGGQHRILACALVGHGGRVRAGKPRGIGSHNPIFVSVGHQLSLPRAVAICAALSLARIPEPVRQADLIGRELLRNAASKASAFKQAMS